MLVLPCLRRSRRCSCDDETLDTVLMYTDTLANCRYVSSATFALPIRTLSRRMLTLTSASFIVKSVARGVLATCCTLDTGKLPFRIMTASDETIMVYAIFGVINW